MSLKNIIHSNPRKLSPKIFEELKACQKKINVLEKESQEEYAKLRTPIELKYRKLKQPVFKKRNEIIKKIPKFWPVSLIKSPKFFLMINDDELDMLLYLTDLEVKYNDNKKTGFEIRFHFEKGSPYFKNRVLTKCMWKDDEGNIVTESSKIKWKDRPSKTEKVGSSSQKLGFFGWLENNEDLTVTHHILLLDLWENPLEYFVLSGLNTKEVYGEKKEKHIELLEKYQQEINVLNKSADKEMRAALKSAEEKYSSLQKPLFEQRNVIISKIPDNFWLRALSQHPELSQVIGDEEEQVFKYLDNLEVESSQQVEGDDISHITKIKFTFKKNSFIKNEVISKDFVNGFTTYGGGKSSSTEIDWKKPLQPKIVRFQDDKSAHGSSEIPLTERKKRSISDYKYFFDWFNDNSDPLIRDDIGLKFLKFWLDPVKFYLAPNGERKRTFSLY